MGNNQLYAVLTGDIVKFSKLSIEDREFSMSTIKSTFKYFEDTYKDMHTHYTVYRGDSFQAVISDPRSALEVCVMIRAALRASDYQPDVRIAIGIGTIDYRRGEKISEWDGEAFRRSGPVLDEMKGDRRLQIKTPWKDIDAELSVEFALLDLIVRRWSIQQSEAILLQLKGHTQEQIANEIGISQPAIQQRLRFGGASALADMLERYRSLVGRNIRP